MCLATSYSMISQFRVEVLMMSIFTLITVVLKTVAKVTHSCCIISQFDHMILSIYRSLHPSIHPLVHPSLRPSLRLSFYHTLSSIHCSVDYSIDLSFINRSIYQLFYPPTHPSIYPFVAFLLFNFFTGIYSMQLTLFSFTACKLFSLVL